MPGCGEGGGRIWLCSGILWGICQQGVPHQLCLPSISQQGIPRRILLWAIIDEAFIVNFALEAGDESGCPGLTKYKSSTKGYKQEWKGLYFIHFLTLILEYN